ncbi:hypothetical protein GSI_12732 [Ganoderma sinense ZZ0214-1]|uniref:F-box domain-containing protein n=1 Tax=Ganoderma sinense ZZ0214-1 TaxID=1077348 RepID=A0A2G8RTL0_9APHY|nr:hypothetical protein GSI_12732 [Ganoderma sinense ZZ0214-1]
MPPRKKLKVNHAQEGATTNTRRSTRASSKVATPTTIATDASNAQPPVASAAPTVVKLRRGCLKDIPNFAVEIQLMIFGNLHPQDLFNLSRTSKMFHQFFLHRSNEALWEAALENAQDLPERPPWMDIPAFIHLLYSTHCHNCGCANIRKVIWPWFARYCSSCLREITCTDSDVSKKFSKASCSVYCLGDVLHGIEAPITGKRSSHFLSTRRKVYWYLNRHVDDVIVKWSTVPEPRGWDSENVKEFRRQCANDIRYRLKYAYGCRKWHDEQEEDHKDELRNGRTERFSAIIKKLKETGWEKELDFLGPDGLEKMSCMPVVRQSAKLTKKGWEKVQETLHTFLTETRATRLEEERKSAIRQRFADLDEAIIAHCVTLPRNAIVDCRPVALDLALQKELEPIANAPSAETVTRETFATIVPKLIDNWQAEQRQFLQSLFRRFIKRVPPGVDILDLAVAVVFTKSYSDIRIMHYPHMLANVSLRRVGGSRGRDEFPSTHYAAVAASDPWRGPFSLHSLDPKEVVEGIEWMTNIVLNLGLDPDTATISDLEQCEGRVRCLRCPDAGRPDHAYTWDAAFAHTARHRDSFSSQKPKHDRWAGIPESDLARVKELEAVSHVLSIDSDCWWSCALCVNWKGWKESVRNHLASE